MTERESYNIIDSYITHLNLTVLTDFYDCKSKSRLPDIPEEKTKIVYQCEQCIKKMLNESLTQNVNAKTFKTVTEVITEITTAAATKATIASPTYNFYLKNFQIFDGFDTIYPTTFVQKIVDMSITPTINHINKLLIETKKSLDKLQTSTTKYENTFYDDIDIILQTVK